MEWPQTPRGRRPNPEYFYMGSTNSSNSGPIQHGYGDAGRGSFSFTPSMPQTIVAEAGNDYRKIFEWAAVHSKEFIPAAHRAQTPMCDQQDEILENSDFDFDCYSELTSESDQIFHTDSAEIDIFPPSEGSMSSYQLSPSSTRKTIAQLFKEKVWARAHEPNHHILFHEDEPYEFNFKGLKKNIFYPNSSDSEGSDSRNTDFECFGPNNKSDTNISGLTNDLSSPRMEKGKCETQEKMIPPMTKYNRFGVQR